MVHLKENTRKLISLALSIVMVFGLLPAGPFVPMESKAAEAVRYRYPVYKTIGGEAKAANGIDRWEENGYCTDYTPVTNGTLWGEASPEAGKQYWYVASGDITISNTVTVSGDVHLILKEGCDLSVTGADKKAGIRVTGTGNSLTVYSQAAGGGVLSVSGGNEGAGIGGGSYESGSNITINGGTVIVNGGRDGAGIGGGMFEAGSNITINGGTVIADGGSDYGAGIGGGSCGSGSNITINGGTVEANGSANGAGIGGGGNRAGNYIKLNGGTITATGGSKSPGIGSGYHSPPQYDAGHIFAAEDMEVRADSVENPTAVIKHDAATDLASSLDAQRYVTAGAPAKYLTFTAEEAGAAVALVKDGDPDGISLQYSMNGNNSWSDYSIGTAVTLTKKGDSVKFRGYNPTLSKTPGHSYQFRIEKRVAASGDVTSMLNGYGGDTALAKYCFYRLFAGCSSLTTAPDLPSTKLASSCYYSMFSSCTSLTKAPALPAAELAYQCYYDLFANCTSLTEAPSISATVLAEESCSFMFNSCESLTAVPDLSATELAAGCCNFMFAACTSLVKAPALPATELAKRCYNGMFYGCRSLTEAPALPATVLAEECYLNMFYWCKSLTTAPALPATELAEECYMQMFYGCSSLTAVPELPAAAMADKCYYNMFIGCTSLRVAETADSEAANKIFTCPDTEGIKEPVTGMFQSTGGAFTDTPAAGKTYFTYTSKVKLDENGGTAETAAIVYADKNKEMPALTGSMPTRTGYTFAGYYDSKTGGIKYYNADGTSAKNWDRTDAYVTLYAQWSVAYTVQHYQQNVADNEYTLKDTDNLTGMAGSQTEAEAKSYEGFTAQPFSQQTISSDGTASVRINYNRNTYTATFKSDGQTYFTEQAKYGALLDEPAAPAKQDYIFGGWYKEAAFSNGWNFSADTMPAGNRKLYAKWNSKNPAPDAPTGLVVTNPSYEGGSDGKISGVNSTMEYSADNKTSWTKVTGTEITGLSEGAVYVRVAETASTMTGKEACVAVGNIILFDVKYDLGGKGTDYTYKVASGSTAKRPASNPAFPRWTFVNWFKQGLKDLFDFTKEILEDTTIYAGWEKEAYTAVFNANGGSGSMDDMDTVDWKLTLPANEFTAPKGCQFAGWCVGSKMGEAKAPGTEVELIEDVTVFAMWEEKTGPTPATEYTATFDANGGSGSMNSIGTVSKKIKLPENAYTAPAGYQFAGWCVGSKMGEAKAPGTEVELIEDTTVYAMWEEKTGPTPPAPPAICTVRFDVESAATKSEKVPEGTEITLPTVSKEGYTFKGWAVTTQQGEFDPTPVASPYTVEEDVLFHALFAETKKIDGKDIAVATVKNETMDLSGVHTDAKEKAVVEELKANQAVSVASDVFGAVSEAGLKKLLDQVPGANELTFGLNISLVEVSGFAAGSTGAKGISYMLYPWALVSKAGGDPLYMNVDNEDLNGRRISFRLAIPSGITEKYALLEHISEEGSMVESRYVQIRTATVDGKAEKYVEADASRFSYFNLSFTNTLPTYEDDSEGSSSWWKSTDAGWVIKLGTNDWYFVKNNALLKGWYQDSEDGRWYYLDPVTGKMLTGWVQVNGKWYYLNPEQGAQTWVKGTDGKYHYDPNSKARPYGSMYCSETTPDGYKVDKDGAWVK